MTSNLSWPGQYLGSSTSASSSIADITVGLCSLCGGEVKVPGVWGGMQSPVPTCSKCHATEKPPKLPVLDMEAHV